jgi:hypothetical protein
MCTVSRVDSAALERRRGTQPRRPLILLFGIAAITVLSASCAPTLPAAGPGPDPADPNVHVPGVQYRSIIASYRSSRPVEPGPCRDQNESGNPGSRQ